MSEMGGNTEIGSGEIRKQVATLKDPVIDRRHDAIAALRGIGEPAVSPLIAALAEAADNDLRWYTAIALSRIGKPAVVPLITKRDAASY